MRSNYVIDSDNENENVCVRARARYRSHVCGLETLVAQTHTCMYEYIAGVKIPVAWEARW